MADNTASIPVTIAGIGASAGGIKALQAFFSVLPGKTGAAFVVVVHLDPGHESELAKVIGAKTSIPVEQVENTVRLEPDHVYVIPPNRKLTVTGSEVSASNFDEPRGRRTAIDQFFCSLSEHGDGFAIVLSGAGSDGALGVRAMKEAGGIILVQDPNEAEYASMPRAAIASGHADFVLPARELAAQFAELVRSRQMLHEKGAPEESEEVLGRVLAYLRICSGHDFSQYKRASLLRRLDRRAQVVKAQNLHVYLDYLRAHPDEVQALFADLLISVTRFFRDADAFEALERNIVPAIIEKRGAQDTIRIWVPGCATGEEAYSIAMVFLDQAARREIRPSIQIFATDLDARALSVAREGCYPEALSADIPEERLLRYFTRQGDEYRIRREVRDLIVFAQHSVLKDPPFSRLDLISCRNFLIYINRELQQRVISIFNYALVSDGYLFLGSSETADHPEGLFRTVDRSARIFQSTGPRLGEALSLSNLLPNVSLPEPVQLAMPGERGRLGDAQQVHRKALIDLGPPSILVDEAHRILNVSERAGLYLLHPPGPPTMDITDLVRPELSPELRVLLNRAFQLGESSMSLPILVQFNGHSRYVCVQAGTVNVRGHPPRALVLFIESGPALLPVEMTGMAETANSDSTIKRLQEELIATRANLKVSRQQFENATENLRAANEELQSINEEYRSTAEELETSREELQSVNEELQTLNSELKSKLDAVSRAHNDLENLMIATDVGTLFLDRELRIKRFTPRMRELFNINSSDEGRSIGDFTNRLNYADFEQDARSVMEEKTIVKRTVQGGDRWYLMTMHPYRTADDNVEGVVATFVDTTPPGENPQDQKASARKPTNSNGR